jgi:hypothetical protein
MRFKELRVGERIITKPTDINKELTKFNLQWLIDSEIEDAEVEIKNNTLIWNDGKFITGHWQYGIWKDGQFRGTWENGIWEKGNFDGKWRSGIKK